MAERDVDGVVEQPPGDGCTHTLEDGALEAVEIERVGKLGHQQRGEPPDHGAGEAAEVLVELLEGVVDGFLKPLEILVEDRAFMDLDADLAADRAEHRAGSDLPDDG